jgi:molybdate transport system substrate-binding protein
MRNLSYILVILITTATPVYADELLVAVAANFQHTLREIVVAFEADSGHTVSVSGGSTGRQFAQIQSGAPFDVFLAADEVRPTLLVQQGHAAIDSQFEYAVGRLALLSNKPLPEDIRNWLTSSVVTTIAIANPRLAPYGVAALQTMEQLDLTENLSATVVMGENVNQALQFVASGNATAGFVALSQLQTSSADTYWVVPANLHQPIRQQGVILRDSPAAREFVTFMQSAAAAEILTAHGYELPK